VGSHRPLNGRPGHVAEPLKIVANAKGSPPTSVVGRMAIGAGQRNGRLKRQPRTLAPHRLGLTAAGTRRHPGALVAICPSTRAVGAPHPRPSPVARMLADA
jgi:hypothetical protein